MDEERIVNNNDSLNGQKEDLVLENIDSKTVDDAPSDINGITPDVPPSADNDILGAIGMFIKAQETLFDKQKKCYEELSDIQRKLQRITDVLNAFCEGNIDSRTLIDFSKVITYIL